MFCNHWRNKADREKKKAYLLKLELEDEKDKHNKNIIALGRFAEKQMRILGLLGNAAILEGHTVPNEMTVKTCIAVIEDVINGYKEENRKLKATIRIYEAHNKNKWEKRS